MKKYFILICGALLFLSCAARKVTINKSETKTDSIIKNIEIVKDTVSKKEENKTNINIFSDTNEIKISPVDNSKEFMINGITYRNVVLSVKNTKSNTLYTNDKIVSQNASKQQINVQDKHITTSQITKDKIIDKKANYAAYISMFIILLITYFIYRYYKRI